MRLSRLIEIKQISKFSHQHVPEGIEDVASDSNIFEGLRFRESLFRKDLQLSDSCVQTFS